MGMPGGMEWVLIALVVLLLFVWNTPYTPGIECA